jgi:RNA polymerase sigma-70 factor (ECF subfamily)
MSDGSETRELVARHEAGDTNATNQLAGKALKQVYPLAKRMAGEEGSDLAQEAALVGVKPQAGGYRVGIRAYWGGVIRNKVRDWRRANARRKKWLPTVSEGAANDEADDRCANPCGEASKADRIKQLKSALQKLPDDQRTALLLRYVEDLSMEQIERAMSKTNGQVRRLLRCAIEQLRATPGLCYDE